VLLGSDGLGPTARWRHRRRLEAICDGLSSRSGLEAIRLMGIVSRAPSVGAPNGYARKKGRRAVAEYCIVFVESDGWSFKELEPVFNDLETAKRDAVLRLQQTGLPVLGVADRQLQQLIWRSDGGELDVPMSFQVWPTD
jgi:hypothetical protein